MALETKDHTQAHSGVDRTRAQSYLWLATLVLGYIGVYLCRKNLSVANPILRSYFGANRGEIGTIASVSTVAYAVGKFCFGPIIDRFGGRFVFFGSLLLVAVFGAVGGFASSVSGLIFWYSLNRLAGSASWGSMMKLIPNWFAPRDLSFASALLSLGFVFGGICATLLAGEIAALSSNNWRMIMSLPSVVLLAILLLNALVLPKTSSASALPKSAKGGFVWRQLLILLQIRQFWIVCALSFTLTLLRETFNTWTVDFFRTEGGPEVSNRMAAFMSTPFDAFGAAGILALGWAFGRMGQRARTRVLFAILTTLTLLLYFLPGFFKQGLWLPTVAVALIGFLAYGPYSLLAGVLSVEIRGPEHVGMVAGIVDGCGYVAGILAGEQFGRIVDHGGYKLGFECLAVLSLISAVLCLFLYPKEA